MATMSQIVQVLADHSHEPHSLISHVYRTLRMAEVIVSHRPGLAAPDVTAEDIATLLIAHLGAFRVVDAPEAFKLYGSAERTLPGPGVTLHQRVSRLIADAPSVLAEHPALRIWVEMFSGSAWVDDGTQVRERYGPKPGQTDISIQRSIGAATLLALHQALHTRRVVVKRPKRS